jgi:hypothetical protein
MRSDKKIGEKLVMYNFSSPSLRNLGSQEIELDFVSEGKSTESMKTLDKLSTINNTEESSLFYATDTHSLRRENSFDLW